MVHKDTFFKHPLKTGQDQPPSPFFGLWVLFRLLGGGKKKRAKKKKKKKPGKPKCFFSSFFCFFRSQKTITSSVCFNLTR